MLPEEQGSKTMSRVQGSPEVVVHGDERHETREAESRLVALSEGAEAEEEEDGGCRHGREGEAS